MKKITILLLVFTGICFQLDAQLIPCNQCTILITETHTNPCYQCSNGSINITATGCNSPYSYLWSNSSIIPNLTGLPCGTYTVTVTDLAGCTATLSVELPCGCDPSCYWVLGGNPTITGSNNILGITNTTAVPLRIYTNNSEKMTITNNGLVGIGTPAPSVSLDVNGQARVRNLIAGTNFTVVTSESNGTLHSIQFPTGANAGTQALLGGGSFGMVWKVGGNATGFTTNTTTKIGITQIINTALGIYTNNTQQVTITSAGNVGIGYTTPSFKLHVLSANTTSLLRLENFSGTNNNTLDINISNSGLGTSRPVNNGTAMIVLNNNTANSGHVGDMIFSTKGLSTNPAYDARVDVILSSTGNLGIGDMNWTATPPTSRLDVNGTENIRVVANDNTIDKILVWNDNPNMFGRVQYRNASTLTTSIDNEWHLTGNNNVTNTSFLGSINAQPLVFKVNSILSGKIDYAANGNVFFGYTAGINNSTGIRNCFSGYQAGSANTTGFENTANGFQSLMNNTIGYYNTSFGAYSFSLNTTGIGNTSVGSAALYQNVSGYYNTSIGHGSLYSNSSGSSNTATGVASLYLNSTGYSNSSTGDTSMYHNTTGYNNTADGYSALFTNTTGYCNTAVGHGADVLSGDLHNATALGCDAIVDASDHVQIGNTAITQIRGGANLFIFSDGRFKKEIQKNVPGLSFIQQLNPVTYHYDLHKIDESVYGSKAIQYEEKNAKSLAAKEKIIYSGFIAQDVEKAAKAVGYEFSGLMKPQNEKDHYSLSYADFVVPLVKAVQEQQDEIVARDEKIKSLESQLIKQQEQINSLALQVRNCCSTIESQGIEKENKSITENHLEQNEPNPFSINTTIRYSLMQQFPNSFIRIESLQGIEISSFSITEKGSGQIMISANTLQPGTYIYELVVNGKFIDSKKMVVTK